MPGITSAYLEAIALAKDMDALKKRVRSYQNDLKIKEIGNAVQSTSHGISGYPKIITWQRGKESREGFMKHFTLPEELEQHRLYEFLLGQSGEHPFRTAAAAMISPFDTSPYHITPQGERKDLSEAQSKLLQSLTIFIASAYHSCNEGLSVKNKFLTHVKERPVAFFERINGVGLLDYLKTNYAQLSKDKKDTLIEHLGMITFLDFVLGHQDRMLPIDNQAFSPLLDPLNILESNLGNLMLTPDGETIFAIDNGLRPGVDVVSTQELRESALPSLEVLKETLQDNKVHENLAVALSKALELPIEEEDDDTGNLATLKGDLTQDSFKTSLIQGMQKMEQMLIKKLIPKWEEGKFNLSLSQELTATIDSRLLAFTEAAQTRNREEQIPGMV
ncbi:MAG: hypothetical protein KGI80_04055 [Verrucomicrobiota bacterium]|nr:hypothetical protein [Verrucomicrobiota bacterium]